MSCTSLKISGTCADERLTLADDALTASPADAAVGIHDDGAGLHKDLKKPFFPQELLKRVAKEFEKE